METAYNRWKAKGNNWRSKKLCSWEQGSCGSFCSYSCWWAPASNPKLACGELWFPFCCWWHGSWSYWSARTSLHSNYGWLDGWTWCCPASYYWCSWPAFIWICKTPLYFPTATSKGMSLQSSDFPNTIIWISCHVRIFLYTLSTNWLFIGFHGITIPGNRCLILHCIIFLLFFCLLISYITLVHQDIAGTLATEAAEDSAQVAKLRSALESVDHKRRKVSIIVWQLSFSCLLYEFIFPGYTAKCFLNQILQQMKSDVEMLNLENGATPIRNPSTAAEDARLASLISLDGILKQVKVYIFIYFLIFFNVFGLLPCETWNIFLLQQDIMRQTSVNVLSKSKKRSLLVSLDELSEQMPSLLDIDHPCAQRHISEARYDVEVCRWFNISACNPVSCSNGMVEETFELEWIITENFILLLLSLCHHQSCW